MNNYGIPAQDERAIRSRHTHCVYCRKAMTSSADGGPHCDRATIEHLNRLPPWTDPSTVVMCCWSCNSSRGNKALRAWFETAYCQSRRISLHTVSEEVREYIDRHEGA